MLSIHMSCVFQSAFKSATLIRLSYETIVHIYW